MNRFPPFILIVFSFLVTGNALANARELNLLQLRSPNEDQTIYIIPTDEDDIAIRDAYLEQLQEAAFEATAAVHVPYIWGGNSIGTVEECMSCNICLMQKKAKPKTRISACPSCNRCGIDCSHLINQIFAAAGLDFPYAASATLGRASSKTLFLQYQLIDLGKDFARALPGDIMVYRHHVGLLMANHGGQRGDLIHASRFAPKGRPRTGGIRYDIDSNIVRARGGLIRILRHQKLGLPGRVPLS